MRLYSVIIFILVNYDAFLFSQTTVFSREFASYKSHVPIQIINTNPNCFYVLRYNKQIHDFTIERRKKSSFEILNFTALKLDSVNANWFDYENLDYLFFEYNFKVYFVFEKVLNLKKSIFIKQIDTLGKSSGFKEIASIDKDNLMTSFDFVFKRANPSGILIVGEYYYQNATAKKIVLFYNLDKNENTRIIKLPLENTSTGFSQSFECIDDRLYYLLSNTYLHKQRRVYAANQQNFVPVYYRKMMHLKYFNLQQKEIKETSLSMNHYAEIKNLQISTSNNQVTVLMQYVDDYDANKQRVFLFGQAFNNDLSAELFSKTQALDESIEQQLTFYDGGDDDNVSEKNYQKYKSFSNESNLFTLAQRTEENYAKELFFWKTDLHNGEMAIQKVLPRKIFYFNDRTRFKSITEVAMLEKNNQTLFFLLENKNNAAQNPNGFYFNHFKKQKYLWGANLMAYTLDDNGLFTKKVIYTNGSFVFVPLKYETNQKEFIFYLNKGKKEKFAILTL